MPVQWIPGQGYFANSYVFGSILIDAGVLPMAVEPYRDQIERIVLTHCHFDHIAHVKEIAHMCDAEILIHRGDARGLLSERENLSMFFGSRFEPVVPSSTVGDGDQVGPLRVIHTPGHTPGSISLYDEESRTLFSGDTVFTDGGFGRFDFPGGSATALLQSLRRLADLEVRGLYPGHGEPVDTGGDRHIAAAYRILSGSYG
jgi:hydroxyacylglutathione hydrolase